MAEARVIALAEAARAAVRAAWDAQDVPPSGADAVSRVYEVPIADAEQLDALEGRQVWLFPAEYGRRAMTRGIDDYRPTITAVIAERYAGQSPVPAGWLDERLAWVEEVVFRTLADPRRPAVMAGATPEDGANVVPYDVESLVTQRLFLSVVTVPFRLQYP